MTVIIRKLPDVQHEYLAYARSVSTRATYFLHFTDDIWGALSLNNFVEMLRKFFAQDTVKVELNESQPKIKNQAVLDILRDQLAPNSIPGDDAQDTIPGKPKETTVARKKSSFTLTQQRDMSQEKNAGVYTR